MGTASATTLTAAPGPLRNSKFRLWWAGSAISLFGDQFYIVALPWLVLQITGSSIALGMILMAASVPRAVLMLIGGAATDRASPRRIMIATAAARTIFVGAIAALIYLHWLRIWQLYFLAFGFGVADAFYMPASLTFLTSLVAKEQLVAANSVTQSTTLLVTIAGPAPAGITVKAVGAGWALLLDAVSFLFVIGALWRLPDPPKAQTMAKPGLWNSIADGLKYVYKDVAMRSLMLVSAVLNLCMAGPITVGLAYLTKQRFSSPTAYGICVSAVAAGALAGTLMAKFFSNQNRGALLLQVTTVLGICTATIGLWTHLWLIAIVLFVMGVGSGTVGVHINAWFQQRVDRAVLGRVASVAMFASLGLLPISYALAGVLAHWSVVWMFVISGGSVVLVSALAWLQQSVREI